MDASYPTTRAAVESGAESPFHEGERQAQQRAGVQEKMAKVGGALLRDYMPQQHRDFFPLLPTLFVGGSDAAGLVWASVLWQRPGFVRSPDPTTLRVDARFLPDDPLAASLAPGWPLGCLGLQFETRRRNRANGAVGAVDDTGFSVNVLQSFGNCAKYIQTRELSTGTAPAGAGTALRGDGALPPAAVDLITHCDTFFIASHDARSGAGGADVSHRGGKPGFVRVDMHGVLTWPDFQGNNFFNTIGNLLADPRAGLLFADFERGDLLHLSGRAEVLWEGTEVERFQGAMRVLRFTAERHVYRPNVLPLRWKLRDYSPQLDATGSWN